MPDSFDPNRNPRRGTSDPQEDPQEYGQGYAQGFARGFSQDDDQEDDQESAAYPQQPGYPDQAYGQSSYPQPGAYPRSVAGSSRARQPGYAQRGYPPPYPQQSSGDVEAPTSTSAPVYAPAPPRRRSWATYLVVGVVLVVLACCVLPAAILLRNQGGQTTTQPTPAPGQVVYQSLLTVPDNKWPNSNGCAFQADGYHVTNNSTCIAHIDTPNDTSIAVNVVQTSGQTNASHGIALRRASANDYYIFGISSAGTWAFVKYADNMTPQMLEGFKSNSAIKTGLNVTNAIEVRAKGSHFDFYVNGTKVGQHDDGSYTSGLPGLTGNSDATIVYTNVKVSKLVG